MENTISNPVATVTETVKQKLARLEKVIADLTAENTVLKTVPPAPKKIGRLNELTLYAFKHPAISVTELIRQSDHVYRKSFKPEKPANFREQAAELPRFISVITALIESGSKVERPACTILTATNKIVFPS